MHKYIYLLVVFFIGCAGINKGCSALWATNVGADWLVVKLTLDGIPYRCWKLKDVSVDNESQSDGIYWKNEEGNLVHISGSYDYIQVKNDRWDDAFEQFNLTIESCKHIRNRKLDTDTYEYRVLK